LEQDALCKLAAAPTDVFNSYGPLAQSAASPLLRGLKRPKPSHVITSYLENQVRHLQVQVQ